MFEISIFPLARPGKDSAKAQRVMCDFTDLPDIITNNAWSQTIFKNNYRNRENFESAAILAFDIDNGLSIEDAINTLKNMGFMYIIASTKSHQVEKNGIICDRFRILLQASSLITSGEVYKATWTHIANQLGSVDQQTSDESRYYYPCTTNFVQIEPNGKTVDTKQPLLKPKVFTASAVSELPKSAVLGVGFLTVLKNIMADNISGNWSTPLHNMGKDLARSGLPKEMADYLAEAIAPKAFDEHDWSEFNKGYEKNKNKPALTAILDKKNQDAEMIKFLKDYFDSHYLVLHTQERSRGRILALSGNNLVHTANMIEIRSKAAEIIYDYFGLLLSADHIKTLVDTWLLHAEVHDIEPKVVAFKDDPSLAYHRLDFEPEPGEYPVFQAFLNRVANADALMAFTWSLFEDQSYEQQYVWINGSGGDGKSSYIEILSRLLGEAYVASSSDAIAQNDFTASLVGKRLVTFSDTNNPKFTTTGKMKAVTGGDIVSVRPLYANRYSAKLRTKVMICSNYMPEIPNQAADRRRLILCLIAPLSEDTKLDRFYVDKLWSEIKPYLYACREKYYELAGKNHGPIECDQSVLEAAIYATEWRQQNIFAKYFQYDENSDNITTIDEIMEATHYDLRMYGLQQRDMEQFIKNTLKSDKINKPGTDGKGHDSRAYGYKGIIKL